MSDHCWISEAQVERIKPYFPRSHGRPRVDDRRVISGIDARVIGSLRAKKNLTRSGSRPISEKLESGLEQNLVLVLSLARLLARRLGYWPICYKLCSV
jgi:hypothetical protein